MEKTKDQTIEIKDDLFIVTTKVVDEIKKKTEIPNGEQEITIEDKGDHYLHKLVSVEKFNANQFMRTASQIRASRDQHKPQYEVYKELDDVWEGFNKNVPKAREILDKAFKKQEAEGKKKNARAFIETQRNKKN